MFAIKPINLKHLKYKLLLLAVFMFLFCVFIPGAQAGDPADPTWDTADNSEFEIWESSELEWDAGTLICSAALTDDYENDTVSCESGEIGPSTTYRVQMIVGDSIQDNTEMKFKIAGDYIEHRNVKGGWAGTNPTLLGCAVESWDGQGSEGACGGAPDFNGNDVRIEAINDFNFEAKIKAAPWIEGFMYTITTDNDAKTDSTSYLYVNDNNSNTEDSSKITITKGEPNVVQKHYRWRNDNGGESPFLYVYQNNQYIFFSDFIGKATSKELEYTDYIDITGKTEIKGDKIKLKITEELEETAYIDRIYLLVDKEIIINPSTIVPKLSASDNRYLVMKKGDELYLEFDVLGNYSKIEFVAEGYYVKYGQENENKPSENEADENKGIFDRIVGFIKNIINKLIEKLTASNYDY